LWFHESESPTSVQGKFQDQVSQNLTPNNDYFSVIQYNRAQKTEAVATADVGMIGRIWDEIVDSWDICRVI
jgi:hypothetical protein